MRSCCRIALTSYSSSLCANRRVYFHRAICFPYHLWKGDKIFKKQISTTGHKLNCCPFAEPPRERHKVAGKTAGKKEIINVFGAFIVFIALRVFNSQVLNLMTCPEWVFYLIIIRSLGWCFIVGLLWIEFGAREIRKDWNWHVWTTQFIHKGFCDSIIKTTSTKNVSKSNNISWDCQEPVYKFMSPASITPRQLHIRIASEILMTFAKHRRAPSSLHF